MNALDNDRSLPRRQRSARNVARALGWFSIGLGVVEILMPGKLSRALGMRGSERLLQMYGAREVATGIGLLSSDDPSPWVWGRVAGDALDMATLAAHTGRHNVGSMGMAMATVASVTTIDYACASALSSTPKLVATKNYRDRSGFNRPVDQVRGIATQGGNRGMRAAWPAAGGSTAAATAQAAAPM